MTLIPNISDQHYQELQGMHTKLRDTRAQLVQEVDQAEKELARAKGRLQTLDERLNVAGRVQEVFGRERIVSEAPSPVEKPPKKDK